MYTEDSRYNSSFAGSEELDLHSTFWNTLFHAKNVTKEGLIRFCKKISEFVWRPAALVTTTYYHSMRKQLNLF